MTVRQIGNVFVSSALRGGLLGGLQGPFLALKFAFFLQYTYITPLLGLRWTRLNGYNFPIFWGNGEYVEYGFVVGAHWAAWHLVFGPQSLKMVILWAKKHILDRKFIFWKHISVISVQFWCETNNTYFCVTFLRNSLLGADIKTDF